MQRRYAFGGAVVAAVFVVGVVVAVARRDPPPSPEERAAQARAVATSWLQAWSRDDVPAMRRLLARRVASLEPAVRSMRDGLGDVDLRATARPARLDGARGASVPFDAEIGFGAGRTWRYRGELPLREGEEGWRVVFTPAALHPDLVAGTRLVAASTPAGRGRLLFADGSPLVRTPELRWTAALERSSEPVLAGTPSLEVRLVRGDAVVGVEASFPGSPGADVRSTLDPPLLAAARAALGTEGNAAALVAIQPSTGAVRAVANRPGNGYDRALLGRYPPGSTFKVITSVALLQKGVTPETRISCPKEITVDGRTIRNAEEEELGDISFADAFVESCNTAFIQLAQKLSGEDLDAAARSLGFGRDPNLGAPAATASFPKPVSIVDLVSSAIGQGRVLGTPLQMATVAASIAAGGYRQPHLVEVPTPPPLEPLPEGVASTMQELMRRVVTSGTGRKARLAGTPVAGKTGTAEFGTVAPLRTHAWFIAFRGDLAVAVIVEDGGFGGDAAAPIAADFFRRVGA